MKKQAVLSLIPNGEGWHYIVVKKLPALLTGMSSKDRSDFCCLNCLHSLRTENNHEDNHAKDKKHRRVRDNCHYTKEYRDAAHSLYNLKYSVRKEISIVFDNGSIYNYHFIIKELAEEFEEKVTCLGKNTGKQIIFSVPINKEVARIDKKGK